MGFVPQISTRTILPAGLALWPAAVGADPAEDRFRAAREFKAETARRLQQLAQHDA